MASKFGEMVDEGIRRKGWSDYQLSAAIGLLPGDKAFNPTQIRRLRRGERRNLTHDLVGKLIELLDLDAAEAWQAAGLWPPGLSAEDVRDISERLAVQASAGSRTAEQTEGAPAPATSPRTIQAREEKPASRNLPIRVAA